MANFIATFVDAADAMARKLGGQRLCSHCQKWAKKPFARGGLYFCDQIHASIYYARQQEAMRQAVEKQKAEKAGHEG